MIKFKKHMTEKINQFRYYIITLVTITVLAVTGFYYYNLKKENPLLEEEEQFNFVIDGKNYIMPSPVHSFEFLNAMGFPWKGLAEASKNSKYETGETHSVREFVELAFRNVGIEDWEKYVVQDHPDHTRPAEVDYLIGDYTKAKEKLGWEPEVSFPDLVKMMVDAELEREK
jgi:hypothetical protein